MTTFSLLLAIFVMSLVLSVPLAYILVALFKYRIEKKINSSNVFVEPEHNVKMVQNIQALPEFEKIETFPITIKGFSVLRALPMVIAVVVSALLANCLSFPADNDFSAAKFSIYFLFVCFPIVYYFYFLFEHQNSRTKILWTIIAALIFIAAVYAFIKTDEVVAPVLALAYFYGSSSSLLVLLSIFFSRIREIIYAIFPPLYFALALFCLLVTSLNSNYEALEALHNPVFYFLEWFGLATFSATAVMGLLYVMFGAIFMALFFLARFAYIKKWFNNTIFLFDVLWFFHLSFVISMGERDAFLLWVVATFLVYKIIFYALSIILKSQWKLENRKSLLVLRVFALNKESAFFFRRLRCFWQYQGPIHLIAGYDLTATTIDVDDLLMFISGRMKTRFNLSIPLINKNMESHDVLPDVNGQYRVNEMYCNNATWKTVVDRLVKKVDFVIMDIRSFSRKNNGCAHEIKELIHKVPIATMCFVVDKRTDIQFLKECAAQAWEYLPDTSPNLNSLPNASFMMYDYSSEKGLGKFLS